MRGELFGKYACWFTLFGFSGPEAIEPWGKQLRSLARKGRRIESTDQLVAALNQAVVYWNAHAHPYVWKRQPQQQCQILGEFGLAISAKPTASLRENHLGGCP